MCERADRPTARAGFGSTRSVVRRVRLAMESAAPSPQLQYQLDCQSSRQPATVLISRNASKTPASARSSDAAPSTVHTRASTKAGVATLFTRDVVFANCATGRRAGHLGTMSDQSTALLFRERGHERLPMDRVPASGRDR